MAKYFRPGMRVASATSVVLLLGACRGELLLPITETAPSVDSGGGKLGDFTVKVEPVARFLVDGPDGTILEGLPSHPLSENDAPLVGFALRDATYAYEMQFGQFQPTETDAGPWIPAVRAVAENGSDGSFSLHSSDGKVMARLSASAPEPRHLLISITPGDLPGRRFSMGFACKDGDRFVGFGEQSWDVDQTGQSVPIFVSEQGIGKDVTDDYQGAWYLVGRRHSGQWVMPWTLAKRGFALVAETTHMSKFALCSEGDGKGMRVEVDLPAKVHLFYGPSPVDATDRATATFGKPRVPPPIAFAPWNDAIFGQENVLAVAKQLRQDDVPSSVIWTEDWRGGDWNGDSYALKEEWQVDGSLYPDAKAMTDQLHAEGFKFFVYFNPFLYTGSKAWQETAPNGWTVQHDDGTPYTFTGAKFSETSLLDVTNPDARAWAKQKMKDVIALGADGWMNDFGEWLPTDAKLHGGSGFDLHDEYPILWHQIAREALDEAGVDGTQRLMFVRSGWLGLPPIADVFWAGDQATDFRPDDGLPTVVPMGINVSASGSPAYGSDIAGYQSTISPPSTKELFFRWTELGAFSPVMRTHHGTKPKLEHAWNSDDETTVLFRRYAIEHIRLAPYLMGAAAEAAKTGVGIFRGLFFAFPDEDAAWTIKDEYMLGKAILVAPVMTKGATSRDVWLPPGTWFPWASGAAIEGGTTIGVDAPIDEIPVFARAGELVVRYPDTIRTLDLSSNAVKGPKEIGDDRDVLAFFGGDDDFVEPSGLHVAMKKGVVDAPHDTADYAWNGAPLAWCDAASPKAPCVTCVDANGAEAWVDGDGTLAVTVHGADAGSVVLSGGSSTRTTVVHVRR